MPLATPVLRGNQMPTHLIVPECFSNAADETIDFYHSMGRTLDPWQQTTLHAGLGETPLGEWAALLVALLVQRQNGKGNVAEARGFGGLFLFGDQKIIHSAHRADTAANAWRRAKELIDGSDELSRRVKRMNESSGETAFIELMDGRIWEFRTRGRDGGRGLSAATLFLDEALEMENAVLADLLPTLLAVPGAQVWLFSTPPKVIGQYLTQLRKRVFAGEPDRAWVEWSNPPGADLSDPKVLAAVNPALGIRLTLRMLDLLRGELGDEFSSECGGIWPPDEEDDLWLVIPKLDWEAQQVPATTQIVGRPAFGAYVPPDRSYGAIVACGVCETGGRQIEATVNEHDIIDFRPGTAWMVPRMKELERHDPTVLVIDDKAVADEAETAGLVVHRANVSDVVTGFQLFYDGIAGPDAAGRDVHHIGQKELTDAVAGAGKRKIGNAWGWERHDVATEIALAPAASLALFGHSTPRVHRPAAAAFFASWR